MKRWKARGMVLANWFKTVMFSGSIALSFVIIYLLLGLYFGNYQRDYVDYLDYYVWGTVGMFAVIYVISPWLIRWITGAKRLTPDSLAWGIGLASAIQNMERKMIRKPIWYTVTDDTPNAFCFGWGIPFLTRPNIALTSALVRSLTSEEIEGVIAHEYAHYRNGDLMVTMLVVLAVGVLYEIGKGLLRAPLYSRGGDKNKGTAIIVMMLIGGLAILLSFAGRLSQLAVSRSRERMADATSALITGNPEAMARALEKISSRGRRSRRDEWESNQMVSTLFISNPFSNENIFSTHPAVQERVAYLRSLI